MYKYSTMDGGKEIDYFSTVAMKFGGLYIEEIIQGYQTLNVSGRETLSYNVNMQEGISGRDGAVFFDKTLPPRYLDIQYQLQTSDSAELQYRYRELSELLDKRTDIRIVFRDEPGITYYGQVVEMEQPPEGRLNVVSRFRILCSDPYKYETDSRVEGNPLTVFLRSSQAVKPSLIEVTLSGATNKVIVRNEATARRIILNGDYKTGDKIKILIHENKVLRNGQNITKDLDFVESDFHSFLVKKNDTVSVTPIASSLTLVVQSRWK